MKDTPEDVRGYAKGYAGLGWPNRECGEMLTRYADLLERLARPVSDEEVTAAITASEEAEIPVWRRYWEVQEARMRAALNAYRASLLGEAK